MIERTGQCNVIGEASSGFEALELCQNCSPQVLVLDLDMPGLNGLQTARELQKSQTRPALIFLTMYKEEDMFAEAMSVGASGYVLKDSAVPEIAAAILQVARGEQYISPALFSHIVKKRNASASLLKARPGLSSLTSSERRILKLISDNLTSKEIAAQLNLSVRTVENHRANICSKLELQGAHSLVKFAFDHRQQL